MNRYLFFMVCAFVLNLTGSALAEKNPYKILDELRFSREADQAGWKTVTGGQGKVIFQDQKLCIEDSGTQGQPAKYSNGIEYRGDFSLDGTDTEVRIEMAVARQNPGSTFFLVLFPRDKTVSDEPAIHVFITNGSDGRTSSVFIGRYVVNGLGTAMAVQSVPFGLDAGYILALTSRGGEGALEMSNGQTKKVFTVKGMISEKNLYKPFTVFVGSPVYGNVTQRVQAEVSGLRILTTRTDELASVERLGNGPGRDDKSQYIYLGEAANRKFEDDIPGDGSDGWTDQGNNDLRYIPRGYQYFRNVPFYVSDKVEIVGNKPARACVILKSKMNDSNFPMESKSIEVNGKLAYLYFLQCSAWSNEAVGRHCANYVVTYTDGSNAIIPLWVGKEIAEWWDPKDIQNAVVAWDGKNEVKTHVGFYLFEWKNPSPEKMIKSIQFKSLHTEVVPILIAITGSKEKIQIGPKPRIYQPPSYSMCEYRQRAKTSLRWTGGNGKVTVTRVLPIAGVSEAKQARIDVLRYHANRPAAVTCTIAGVTKKISLKAGELRAQFLFTEEPVLKYITGHKQACEISVDLDDPEGIGRYEYESNPNHDWIPKGEDFGHGIYAVTGIFQVTGWLPIHKISGYIETRPRPVAALPPVIEQANLTAGNAPVDWLGARLCLSGPWQWQPGGKVDVLPGQGWQEINIPSEIGGKVFQLDPTCTKIISAWFKKQVICPAGWQGKRVALQFESVCDFATVYVNGKKCGDHAGYLAFEMDVTKYLKLGQANIIHVFCENMYKGAFSYRTLASLHKYTPYVSHYKGFAYRVGIEPGPWFDQDKPDNNQVMYKGRKLGPRVGSIDEVIRLGGGRYYKEPVTPGQPACLYFSTPGNVPFEKVSRDMGVWVYISGMVRQPGHWEFMETWLAPRARPMGILQDVFMAVTGQARISDVFVKPSVRKGRLEVEMALTNLPPEGAVIRASVRDGNKVVLDLGTKRVESGTTAITLGKDWANPQLWGPSNPYLYFVEVELKTSEGNIILDRRFVRFGFREFWIQGTQFKFNGRPIVIQAVNSPCFYMPYQLNYHRAEIRWWYLDSNQQVNANLLRWHMGGLQFPELADIADEMGMLLEPESSYRIRPYTLIDPPPDSPKDGEKFAAEFRQWVTDQVRHARNHSSIIMWSADNENLALYPKEIPYSNAINNRFAQCVEEIFKLNEAIKKVDPTRVIDNHGDEGIVSMQKWADPRLEIVNNHYADENFFKGWRTKFGKPCMLGEESLGFDFGWCYRGWAQELIDQGKDPSENFYQGVNAATAFITNKIKFWQHLGLAGIYPFSAWSWRHPLFPMWKNVDVHKNEPDITWPALSGEQAKPKCYGHSGYSFNFWDPSAPRGVHIRTCDALKDTFPEVPKLEPRFSPEVIVQVMDRTGKPLRQMSVWLFPTDQPGNPIGVMTDDNGKAWFWCKSGPGEYTTWINADGKWYHSKIVPALLGEWLQVKTVTVELP